MSNVVAAADVFSKMKKLSKKTLNSRHRIFVNDIATELSLAHDLLLRLLTELENAGLVKVYRTDVLSVSLTSYGLSQENYSSPEVSSSAEETSSAEESPSP